MELGGDWDRVGVGAEVVVVSGKEGPHSMRIWLNPKLDSVSQVRKHVAININTD